MENSELTKKFIECIENNTKAIEKMSDVMQVVINNNNYIIDNIKKLNEFATETYSKFNNMLMVLDALSICMFEKNVVEEKRFQEVMEQLVMQHEQRISGKSEKHECNGECSHEAERKADSTGTEK
jgi:hypothetical protein